MISNETIAAPGQRRAGTPQGVILIVVPLFAMLGAVLMAPLLAVLRTHFQQAPHVDTLVPLLLTAPALFLALLSPFAGVLADRIGPRRVLLWCLALYGFAGTAPMYLQSLQSIFVSRLMVGIAEAGLVTAATMLLSFYFDGDARQKWFAYQNALLPWIAGIAIAATGAIGNFNWRMTFALYGSSFVALLFGQRYLYEATRKPRTAFVWRLPPWKPFLWIAAIAVPGSVAFYIAPVELSFLLEEHGTTAPSTVGNVAAVALVLGPLGALASRRLTHLPVGVVLASAMILMGSGLALMALGANLPTIAVGMVIQQIGGGLMLVTALTYILGLATEEQRGLYSGIWWFLYMLAQFVTPLLMSGLTALTGRRDLALLVAGIAIAATSIWLLSARALRRPVVTQAL